MTLQLGVNLPPHEFGLAAGVVNVSALQILDDDGVAVDIHLDTVTLTVGTTVFTAACDASGYATFTISAVNALAAYVGQSSALHWTPSGGSRVLLSNGKVVLA